MTILESDLPAALKPTAVALALFADERGERVFPSVGRLAWLRGLSERAIQKHVSALRELGVLVPVTRGTGGRGRTTCYRVDVSALPARDAYKPRTSIPGFNTQKSEQGFALSGSETVNGEAETTNSGAGKGEPPFTRFSRIVRDVLREPDLPEERHPHFLVEVNERTRERCAKADIAYSGDVVHRAIDSELWKRRRKVAT